MKWQTIVALPVVGLMVWIVVAAVSFGEQVGSTWTEGTTATVVNGLVMACFGGAMFGVFIMSLLIGVALASRLMATPARSGPRAQEPSLWERGRGRGRIPQGWDDEVVDSYGERGRVVSIDSPVDGLRPMLTGSRQGAHAGQQMFLPPSASGAFDGMDDGDGPRFRTGG